MNKDLRELRINIDTATRWYNSGDEEKKEMALTAFPELGKIKLPKYWSDLENISGYYIDSDSGVNIINNNCNIDHMDKNTFKKANQAKASIRTAMYSQLIDVYKQNNSLSEFIKIAEEYEPKVRPILSLFFGEEMAEQAFYLGLCIQLRKEFTDFEYSFNGEREVYSIVYYNGLNIDIFSCNSSIMYFATNIQARDFFDKYKYILEKCKKLL